MRVHRAVGMVVVLLAMISGLRLPPSSAVRLASPTPTPTPLDLELDDVCWRAVTGIRALQDGLVTPYGQEPDSLKRVPGDFDITTYFTVLDRLELQTGYVLDYVYFAEFLGGEPVLYARRAGTPRYVTFEELSRERGEPPLEDDTYLDNVVVEDSQAGFLQFALLRIMADQFYLRWHALYDDATPLCDAQSIETAIAEYNRSGFGWLMPMDVQNEARKLDTGPQVTLGDKSAVVSIVTFTKWGGFARTELTFERSSPHRLLSTDADILVEFDCGMVF